MILKRRKNANIFLLVLLLRLQNIDEVVALIKKSNHAEEAIA